MFSGFSENYMLCFWRKRETKHKGAEKMMLGEERLASNYLTNESLTHSMTFNLPINSYHAPNMLVMNKHCNLQQITKL